MQITEWLQAILPQNILERYRQLKFLYGFKFGQRTWSQEGEDMILRRIFSGKDGFYVDIGAHHPYRYSNTYLLYKNGWHGINVDALPDAIELFRKYRPLDININVGITGINGEMQYFEFNDPAFNTFDANSAQRVIRQRNHAKLRRRILVNTMKLRDLLAKEIREDSVIDFMNIDVEGLDFEVLQSNDWDKYRPKVLAVEAQWTSLEAILRSELGCYLAGQRYEIYGKCVNTVFFMDRDNMRVDFSEGERVGSAG